MKGGALRSSSDSNHNPVAIAAMTLRCIFCPQPLDSTTKPEHVWLASLGGRKTTSRVICNGCNELFGNGPDRELANSVAVIRNLMRFPDTKRRAPPDIKTKMADGTPIVLKPGAIPELASPPFIITELPNGNRSVELRLRPGQDLASVLPHLAGALGATVEQVERMIRSGTARSVSQRIGTQHHQVSLGGPGPMRSMIKSCLVLWATRFGTTELDKPGYADAKLFALSGDPELSKKVGQLDPRTLPADHPLVTANGPRVNSLWVASDASGRVLGHFRLYNTCAWTFTLCDAGGEPNSSIGMAADPSDPVRWKEFTDSPEVPFDWLAQADPLSGLEAPREALTSMYSAYRDAGSRDEIDRIVERVMEKMGVSEGQQLTPEQQKVFVGEVSQRLAAWTLGLPFEEQLTTGEIDRLLKRDQQK
jgi:hypothetical protein